MFEIAPSILSANFTRLAEEIAAVKEGGAKVLHVDVMDGHFVPNITIGLPVVKSIRKETDLTIDTHLMISEPGRYAVEFVQAGANMVSVHVEADDHLQRTVVAIREAGAKAGIAINPATPLVMLEEALAVCGFRFIDVGKSGIWGAEIHSDIARQAQTLEANDRFPRFGYLDRDRWWDRRVEYRRGRFRGCEYCGCRIGDLRRRNSDGIC
jgi:ribulose-phosphate 3-epimerase